MYLWDLVSWHGGSTQHRHTWIYLRIYCIYTYLWLYIYIEYNIHYIMISYIYITYIYIYCILYVIIVLSLLSSFIIVIIYYSLFMTYLFMIWYTLIFFIIYTSIYQGASVNVRNIPGRWTKVKMKTKSHWAQRKSVQKCQGWSLQRVLLSTEIEDNLKIHEDTWRYLQEHTSVRSAMWNFYGWFRPMWEVNCWMDIEWWYCSWMLVEW